MLRRCLSGLSGPAEYARSGALSTAGARRPAVAPSRVVLSWGDVSGGAAAGWCQDLYSRARPRSGPCQTPP